MYQTENCFPKFIGLARRTKKGHQGLSRLSDEKPNFVTNVRQIEGDLAAYGARSASRARQDTILVADPAPARVLFSPMLLLVSLRTLLILKALPLN